MTSTFDELIEEAAKRYSKMSLLQLLAYENTMARLVHAGRHDNSLKRLQRILRSEIETKLR